MYDKYHLAEVFGGPLYGSDADDYFLGNDSRDIMWGWGGDDYLSGGGESDILSKTSGTGYASGGSGWDILSFYWADNPVGINMTDGIVSGRHTFFRFGTDIERVDGSRGHGDYLEGNPVANWLYGHGGDDHIRGMGGDDYLSGGDGNDRLEGGTGTNKLHGGVGADTFVFAEGETTTVHDFDAAEGDRLVFHFDGPPPVLDTTGNGSLTQFDADVSLVGDALHIAFGGGTAIIEDTFVIPDANFDTFWA